MILPNSTSKPREPGVPGFFCHAIDRRNISREIFAAAQERLGSVCHATCHARSHAQFACIA